MFVLMNHTRRSCGVIGVAGVKQPANWPRVRKGAASGPRFQRTAKQREAADPIIEHPDVRRVLMGIRAFVEPARALLLWIGNCSWICRSDRKTKTFGDGLTTVSACSRQFSSGPFGYELCRRRTGTADVLAGHGYIVETGIETICARFARSHDC